ncbi:MAG: carbohydrate ABC transporter permease [Streptomyces sp.]|uniref:ABC transporter permease subunit n=1 Tax=Streptomyces sp. TaxID=1931 RepID=UPI0025EC2225|nr:ABC transporter permease subunit [Streptomyces sp.]MBW8801763.1 carbohydrate ABC transporter permease [Streptomyces sp.]
MKVLAPHTTQGYRPRYECSAPSGPCRGHPLPLLRPAPGAELRLGRLLDGAGWFRTWCSIYLPLSKPIVIASAVLQFMASWNNFLAPAICISNDQLKTLPLAPAGFSSVNGTNAPLLLATSIVVVLPCILIFFLAQRHIVGGISFTGSK